MSINCVPENRREHGCDGCHSQDSTQRFDGRCGDTLWLCGDCVKRLIRKGIMY